MPYINFSNILAPQSPPPPYADYDFIYGDEVSQGYPSAPPLDLSDNDRPGFFSKVAGFFSDAASFIWSMLTFWKS